MSRWLGKLLMDNLIVLQQEQINPIKFVPRPYQKDLDDRIERENGSAEFNKPIFVSWCRRCGKDQWAFSRAVKKCLENPNFRVMYIFPTAKQGRKNILEGVTIEGERWIESVVDTNFIQKTKTGSLYYNDGSIKFKNGSIIDIYGDDADTLVGSNINMLIISEAAMVREQTFNYLYPSTQKVNGEVICISTPRLNSWFNAKFLDPNAKIIKSKLTAYEAYNNDGSRVYTDSELENIKTLMSEEKFASEYMCDMNAFNETSIYGKSLKKATWIDMPNLDAKQVFISFDLGITDNCAMVFSIFEEDKIKIIHHYRNREQPTQHYIDYIDNWCRRMGIPKNMVLIILPQDGSSRMDFVRYLASRAEVYRSAGYQTTVLNFISNLRGIEITRTSIERGDLVFVNNMHLKEFVEIIKGYEWKTSPNGQIILVPKHGSGFAASNDADALEYMAIFFLYEKYRLANSYESGVIINN